MAEAQSNGHRRGRNIPIESQASECKIGAGIMDKQTPQIHHAAALVAKSQVFEEQVPAGFQSG